tara:strand:+ start:293 stop:1192 length:900 start_codon:yes stop_codon:yes gene_type:complete
MSFKNAVQQVSVPAPAKVNLYLAVLGKRKDDYHDIVSVLAKLNLYDIVTVEQYGEKNFLSCNCLSSPSLKSVRNLAEDAVMIWRKFTGEKNGVRIVIKKKIPLEAGLGGGSSDAVATLIGLNYMMKAPLSQKELIHIAAQIGSDCPSFLLPGLCVATGRGEGIRTAASARLSEIKGRNLLLFKPPLGFSTQSVYDDLAKEKRYSQRNLVHDHLNAWEKGEIMNEQFFSNNLEAPVFLKHPYIPELFRILTEKFNLKPMLSGSGSCCFCLDDENTSWKEIIPVIRDVWGEEAFVQPASFI